MLTATRTHYIIDLVTGVIMAHYCYMQADWLSFLIDVKICGFSHQQRKQHCHEACKKCGWSNKNISQQINKKEESFLRETYKMRVEK